MNIGQFARQCILDNPGMKNDDILKIVRNQFPDAKTSYACIAWYKSDMKKKGILVIKPVRTAELVMAEIDALNAELEMRMKELEVLMEEAGEIEPGEGQEEEPTEEEEEEPAEEAQPNKRK